MSFADYKKSKEGLEGHQIESKELFGKELRLLEMTKRTTKNGPCVVVRFKEDPEGFYFGGKTTLDLFEDFQEHDVDITKEEIWVRYSERESQTGRKYIAVEAFQK